MPGEEKFAEAIYNELRASKFEILKGGKDITDDNASYIPSKDVIEGAIKELLGSYEIGKDKQYQLLIEGNNLKVVVTRKAKDKHPVTFQLSSGQIADPIARAIGTQEKTLNEEAIVKAVKDDIHRILTKPLDQVEISGAYKIKGGVYAYQ